MMIIVRNSWILIFLFAAVSHAAGNADGITRFNEKCPAKRLGPEIDHYYHECHAGFVGAKYNACERFIAVFKELMPRSDCARPIDISGKDKYVVPAIWLLGDAEASDYQELVHALVFDARYSGASYAPARAVATELFYSGEFRKVLDAAGEEYEDEWNAHDEAVQKSTAAP